MSNKSQFLGIVTGDNLLEWADKQDISGGFYVPPSVTNGLPNGIETGHFQGWLYSGGAVGQSGSKRMSIMRQNGDYKIYENVLNTGIWAGWKEIATATPPQEYDLPLAEGIIELYPSVYRKDQFKNILIKLAARINSASKRYINVATLPEGYRPPFDTQVPATLKSVSTGTYIASTAKIVGGAINVEFLDTGDFELYVNCTL